MVRMPSADDSYEVRKKAAWFSSWPFSLGEGIRLCIFAAGFESGMRGKSYITMILPPQ